MVPLKPSGYQANMPIDESSVRKTMIEALVSRGNEPDTIEVYKTPGDVVTIPSVEWILSTGSTEAGRTLVVRSDEIRISRSPATSAGLIMRTAAVLDVPVDGVRRLVIVADERNMRTKKTMFRIDADSGEASTVVQLIAAENLAFNPLKHSLVPRHHRMSPGEVDALALTFRTTPMGLAGVLPKILTNDPISMLLGGVPSYDGAMPDIFEITRPGGNVTYRVVEAHQW